MFDLETNITNWRQQMQRAGIKSKTTLDELESHLRDDIEAHIHSGQPPEQAFQTATERFGTPKSLHQEFIKSGSAWDTRKGKETSPLHLTILGFYELIACYALHTTAFEPQLTPTERWSSLSFLLAILLISYLISRLATHFAPIKSQKSAMLWSLTGLSWFAINATLINQNPALTTGQTLTATWWIIAPAFVASMTAFINLEKRNPTPATKTLSTN